MILMYVFASSVSVKFNILCSPLELGLKAISKWAPGQQHHGRRSEWCIYILLPETVKRKG